MTARVGGTPGEKIRFCENLSPGVPGVLAVLLLSLSGVACAHVAPYERGRLAHPSMTDDVAGMAALHVYEVQEGATGGAVQAAASGCGCN